jgi:transposase
MAITSNTDRLYDTDLTDAAWELIAPMLPVARPGGRSHTKRNLRDGRVRRLIAERRRCRDVVNHAKKTNAFRYPAPFTRQQAQKRGRADHRR